MKYDILSLDLSEIKEILADMGEKPFRAVQIYKRLHQKNTFSFEEMTEISSDLRQRLTEKFDLYIPKAVRHLVSEKDGTEKFLFELSDGSHIETVLMQYHHGNSICLSTQVGCKMGCSFCASTIGGCKRNLEVSEIIGQMYSAERETGRHVDSIVLMGIGEPLDNFDNVVRFLNMLSDPEGRGMSLRHVSVSTCGIVPRINELAEMKLGITLSVSLHGTTDGYRSEIMPINRRYHIDELMKACRNYMKVTGRRISFEYAVIEGFNDSAEDAKRLADLIRGMGAHVNVIPVNPVRERKFHAGRKTAADFVKELEKYRVNATVRRTLGADIDAACGQLRREYEI